MPSSKDNLLGLRMSDVLQRPTRQREDGGLRGAARELPVPAGERTNPGSRPAPGGHPSGGTPRCPCRGQPLGRPHGRSRRPSEPDAAQGGDGARGRSLWRRQGGIAAAGDISGAGTRPPPDSAPCGRSRRLRPRTEDCSASDEGGRWTRILWESRGRLSVAQRASRRGAGTETLPGGGVTPPGVGDEPPGREGDRRSAFQGRPPSRAGG